MKHNATSRPKKKRTGCLVWILIALFLLAVLGVGYLLASNEVKGNRSLGEEPVVVEIEEGSSTQAIAELLAENDVINSSLVFRGYNKFKKTDGSFHAGEHTLNPAMSYDEIIAELQMPVIEELPGVSITFPEGTTALRMAMMLEAQGLCTIDEFISACNNETYDVPFYGEISADPNKFIKLEGYLFPDTYVFYDHWTIHDFIQAMLENFDQKVYTPLKSKFDASEYTIEEILSLASLIEKESFGGEEYRVASVFYNRLSPDSDVRMLQSDTSDYFISGVLEYYYDGDAPAAMVAGYDTDSREGFMIGAICNPGYNAIDAALSPEDTPYYYFLTDFYKKFYWAETYEEHVANFRIMEQENARYEEEFGEAGEQPDHLRD